MSNVRQSINGCRLVSVDEGNMPRAELVNSTPVADESSFRGKQESLTLTPIASASVGGSKGDDVVKQRRRKVRAPGY